MLNKKQLFKLRLETSRMFPYNIVRLCLIIPIRQNVNNPGIVTLGRDFIGLSNSFEELEYPEMKNVLAHSVLYYQFKHYQRSKGFVTDKPSKLIWNFASEICRTSFLDKYIKDFRQNINEAHFLSPRDLGLEENLSVEQYYEQLYSAYQEQENLLEKYQPNGTIMYEKQGNSPEDPNASGEAAEINEQSMQEANKIDESAVEFDVENQIALESTQTIKNAISALSRGLNSLPGELQYFSESPETRDRRKINRLRKLFNTCVHTGPGRRITSPRPRRRNPTQDAQIMDDIKVGFKPIAVVVDVSGSTELIRDQIYDILALTIRASRLIDVYVGDVTILLKKRKISRPNQINSMPSGGGTDMAAIMKELDGMNKYHTIIVITDGLTPWPQNPLKAKTFVCLLGDSYGAEAEIPEWIKLI